MLHGPDGTDYPEWIRWTEISPPERIALLHGERPEDPNAFESVVTFTPDGAKIAYTAIDDKFNWNTYVVPVLGGEPHTLGNEELLNGELLLRSCLANPVVVDALVRCMHVYQYQTLLVFRQDIDTL